MSGLLPLAIPKNPSRYLVILLVTLILAYWVCRMYVPLVWTYFSMPGVYGSDFQGFYISAKAFFEGKNPYLVENLDPLLIRHIIPPVPPIVLPTQYLFMLPFFLLTGPQVGAILWIFANLLAGIAGLVLVLKRLSLWPGRSESLFTETGLISILCILIFLRSTPVYDALLDGQSSLLTSWLILIALLSPHRFAGSLALSFAGSLKYSLSALFGLYLFASPMWRRATTGLLLFLLYALLLPVLFDQNPLTLYRDYFANLGQTMESGGINSYSYGGAFTFIHFGFFKNPLLNAAGQAFIICLVVIGIWIEYRTPRMYLSLNFIFFLACATMATGYHRYYDLTLVTLLIVPLCYLLGRQRRYLLLAFSFAALTFLYIPYGMMWLLFNHIGQYVGQNQGLYMGQIGQLPSIPPILGIFTYSLTLFAAILYFFCDETARLSCGLYKQNENPMMGAKTSRPHD